jgi:flagellar hook-associated protein 1 FlgK
MLGLFGTLNLATRSLGTQRQGTEVAGHNLANVNNPAYARQRLAISTSYTIPTTLGPQGTGVESVAIVQLRNGLLDRQILSEKSVHGSLTAQQSALQYAQANLGQLIDRQASGPEGTAATGGVGGQHGIAEELSSLFNAFQGLSTNPTSSAERQVLLIKAQNLTTQFNQVATRLGEVNGLLNQSVTSDTDAANIIIGDVAKLNEQIVRVEIDGGEANDLRDIRQQKIEELGRLVGITTTEQSSGALDITIGGVAMTSGANILDRLETYDRGDGQLLVRAQVAGTPLTLSGGAIQGAFEARDGALTTLRGEIDTLAGELITQVNALHAAGFGLAGTTGEAFFTGTDAASIGVNGVLLDDPGRIQASGVAGATGNNHVMLALAQLADKPIAALGNQTFSRSYGETVARLGQSLASLNTQIANQNVVGEMLKRQRDAISGVSLDEEMTDLIRFQKAFEASARLVTVVDGMLDTVLNMKR